jgi:large subunit ribosomal protein L19
MNLLEKFEKNYLGNLIKDKEVTSFHVGDSVRVSVKVVEGEKERKQNFDGIVIGKKNRGINSSFRVRKLSYGEGVERVFPLYSPNIDVSVIKKGDVRRSKLYYLRDRVGKKARISERIDIKKV